MTELNFVFIQEEFGLFWEENIKPLLQGEAAALQKFMGEIDDEFVEYLRRQAEGDPKADILLTNLIGQVRLKAAQYDIAASDAIWDAIGLAMKTAGKMFGVFLKAAVGI